MFFFLKSAPKQNVRLHTVCYLIFYSVIHLKKIQLCDPTFLRRPKLSPGSSYIRLYNLFLFAYIYAKEVMF